MDVEMTAEGLTKAIHEPRGLPDRGVAEARMGTLGTDTRVVE